MNNMIKGFLFLAFCNFFSQVSSAVELDYYLPTSERYLAEIPTPQSTLGFQVGEWHARPEQIENYFQQLANASGRVKIINYAKSYEQRPLFLVIISSAENIDKVDELRQQHLLMEKSTDRPAVTWMGYSVHGNEASGSNASLLFAYHLAASQDAETMAQLKDQIIIIDPMLNPDGLARFSHWVNMYKSNVPNSDPKTREHNEIWPRGRTNHYWFDLNRDWLLLQHPESRGRIKMYHQWKPNVLTDFHEMGTNSSYFFQPGVKSRQNPLTPDENFELTAKIATYHAAALDNIGSQYYSKESFDDFYYGKGSTYPDINGSVGILFEQASARGHLQESVNGDVSFPFAIKNHLTTSFSTLKAVQENKTALLRYQRNFYHKSKLNANASKNRAIIYHSSDRYRLNEFNKIMQGHQIEYFSLVRELEINGEIFKTNNSFIIPLRQVQYRLIQALFEKRKTFEDNTFYDVSSWTLPVAFDINYQQVSRSDFDKKLLAKDKLVTNLEFEPIDSKTVALAFDWNNFATANLLSFLHQQKITVRVASKPLKVKTNKGFKQLNAGDLIVPVKSQKYSVEELNQLLAKKITQLKLLPVIIQSGLSVTGPDLGSPSLPLLKEVMPLMLIGKGVNSYQAGEVWHLFDQRLNQPLSMMTMAQFSKLKSIKYTHLLMVAGDYSFSNKVTAKIDRWVKSGGILITQSSASEWLAETEWLSSEGENLEPKEDTHLDYSQMDYSQSQHYIGGAIASTTIDITHPLGFGLQDNKLAVFKRGQFSFTEPKESFVAVARFDEQPLIAGYMSKENQKNIANATSILVQGHGKGKLIAFTEDMNFRAFWLGTSRVFVNALYFGDMIKAVQKKEESEDELIKKSY